MAEGAELYEIIERVRRDMVAFREASSRRGRAGALARGRRRLVALPVKRQLLVARAYTLYLELVNVCENAFRTHRLRERRRAPSEARACMTFVLTGASHRVALAGEHPAAAPRPGSAGGIAGGGSTHRPIAARQPSPARLAHRHAPAAQADGRGRGGAPVLATHRPDPRRDRRAQRLGPPVAAAHLGRGRQGRASGRGSSPEPGVAAARLGSDFSSSWRPA